MLVKREDAALLSVIVCLIAGCLCGFGPSINQGKQYGFYWIQALSFASWATEAWFDSETSGYRELFMVEELSAKLFGFELDRYALDIGIAVLLAFAYRVVAFGLLLVVNRQKQR
jgi:hypothetical protein